MKRSISQSLDDSSESGRRTPDGVTRPAFLRTLSIDAEGKRVPVVLQYSQFEQLKDKAKAIVEAYATEAIKRWNV